MEIKVHQYDKQIIAEVISDSLVIANLEDGIDLVGNLYYQGFDKVMIEKDIITEQFFDLKTKLAGEILQKFSNYKIKLAIVGDFSKYESSSLKDFIFESNKHGHIFFVDSKPEAIERFLKYN
ncbi:hypothetical protein GCM10011514_35190 [Emticicia aquatilis]|uniref:DUF4180 domain-containing protein n=1 Tax=Emticicia aquatilis TaxID=1537369 RepID=A0A917DUD2_9BACT|nr:DUF4180 domain-containing protein [Emticicia aquatilis]GGD68033.1 hypothetical protein GCM10011514_35190 [Emticicia aquatilis]